MTTKTKRSTIYLEEKLHKALRLKAAELDASMSDIVNNALRTIFEEDAQDLMDIQSRSKEPSVSFDDFVTSLKASGQL
jgi:hypothetical protein